MKKGRIVKISKKEIIDLAKKDIKYSANNLNLNAGISINENGESGVFFS